MLIFFDSAMNQMDVHFFIQILSWKNIYLLTQILRGSIFTFRLIYKRDKCLPPDPDKTQASFYHLTQVKSEATFFTFASSVD